jgi:hypothetical protein
VGLIYESEDSGQHWLNITANDGYQGKYDWHYNQTFWLMSDNIIAMYALLPWRPDISQKINATYQRYNTPSSNHFESLFGQPVMQDAIANDYIVNSTRTSAVLIRVHNGTVFYNDQHADALIYHALSLHYLGREVEARTEYNTALNMFNSTCVVDPGVLQTQILHPWEAPSDISNCMNMKISLLLYGAEVLNVTLPNFSRIEQLLWSMQQANGGITTLADGHGNRKGSANAETTALTLLIYNQALITRLRNNVATIPEYPSAQILILAATLTTIAPILLIHRRRKTK